MKCGSADRWRVFHSDGRPGATTECAILAGESVQFHSGANSERRAALQPDGARLAAQRATRDPLAGHGVRAIDRGSRTSRRDLLATAARRFRPRVGRSRDSRRKGTASGVARHAARQSTSSRALLRDEPGRRWMVVAAPRTRRTLSRGTELRLVFGRRVSSALHRGLLQIHAHSRRGDRQRQVIAPSAPNEDCSHSWPRWSAPACLPAARFSASFRRRFGAPFLPRHSPEQPSEQPHRSRYHE
jgi:hypothetical protein